MNSDKIENYVTADLFIASAITQTIGHYPDQYIVTDERRGANPKVIFRWSSIPIDIKRKMDRRELLVCPFKFKPVYLRLRKNVNRAIDQYRRIDKDGKENQTD